MARFVDQYMPDRIARFTWQSIPRWDTTITLVANGGENANQNWEHPLHTFESPGGVQCWEDVLALHSMWMVLRGPAYTFPIRDPLDHASRPLLGPDWSPPIGSTDQILGVGDGFTRSFQLTKRYTFGANSYDRIIYRPVVSTVVVAMNALDPGTADPTLEDGPYTWEVDRLTGIVTFDHAPADGLALTAGFLFDVEARFEADDVYQGIVQAYRTAGHADLSFHEIRPC